MIRCSILSAGVIRWSRRRWRRGASGLSPMIAGWCREDRLWLIGGPNMGGKSTFLRANALIVLLAQAGGFVPAEALRRSAWSTDCSAASARATIWRAGDRLSWSKWSRPPRSWRRRASAAFVILDEVGRGTSTYDGLALAWAVVEAVHGGQPLVAACLPRIITSSRGWPKAVRALTLHHVRAREWKGDLVLLHELAKRSGGQELWPGRGQAGGGAAHGDQARQGRARSAGKKGARPREAWRRGSMICRCLPPRSRRRRTKWMRCATG